MTCVVTKVAVGLVVAMLTAACAGSGGSQELGSPSARSTASVEQSASPMAPIPSDLEVAKRTTTSIVLAWNPPADAPAPDQYLIFRDGDQVQIVAGQTGFADRKLTPATGYRYTVAAMWGSRTSETSEPLTTKTRTPSLAAARLVGAMEVQAEMTRRASGGTWPKLGEKLTMAWVFRPTCDSGACDVVASVDGMFTDKAPFKVPLTREGKNYSGSTVEPITYCRSTRSDDTVTIRVRVTKAAVVDGEWIATAVKGTITVLSPYTSVGGGYCAAGTNSMSVVGY